MKTRNRVTIWLVGLILCCGLFLTACGGGGGGGDNDDDSSNVPATGSDYTLLAWNDLGMHCLNPTYDTLVILPPYNTVWAQLVKRGSPPQIVTSGVTLSYRLVNNTSSADKTYSGFGSDYGQFWTYVLDLFGITLTPDTGLNLVDPTRHNGLSGTMVVSGSHFEVNGIPATPVDDDGVWNPYQVIEITAKDGNGNTLAQTRATVPTSDEINCAKCHGTNAFANILQLHDAGEGTSLASSTPVLCASCHGSPALNAPNNGAPYLSQAIHGYHATHSTATCYDCHPGTTTKCNRSLAHTAADGNCTSCHGTLQNVATTIANGRIPWGSEPNCSDCHTGVAEVNTGTVLYRNAVGHGGMNCAACHGSPHAMYPSREATDNYQPLQYQGKALSLGSCAVCHSGSKGEGSGEFIEEHGSGNPSACNVCHTSITSSNTSLWPHAFQWTNR
ncbi:multiheme c-type cytochrome [Pelobacter seleniigenes]|uniref:multiheme c-type cytochrome n=1 Tax=Pelobacter seleniigenes TaxID=407188 RepID=UPI0004A6FD54|nr:multiheme c-type cytochrome [Pelobacter seleniigenes]